MFVCVVYVLCLHYQVCLNAAESAECLVFHHLCCYSVVHPGSPLAPSPHGERNRNRGKRETGKQRKTIFHCLIRQDLCFRFRDPPQQHSVGGLCHQTEVSPPTVYTRTHTHSLSRNWRVEALKKPSKSKRVSSELRARWKVQRQLCWRDGWGELLKKAGDGVKRSEGLHYES